MFSTVNMAEHDALVQHLVVLEVVQQRAGNGVGARGEEYGRAGDAQRRLVGALEKQIERQGFAADFFQMDAPADAPGLHDHEHAGRDRERQPAALRRS